MDYPKLTPIPKESTTIDVFRGLNRNERIGAGEFHQMENLSGDSYPLLTPRGRRQTVLIFRLSPRIPKGKIVLRQKVPMQDRRVRPKN